MQSNEKLEEISMTIIAESGAARSLSFEALEKAKSGDFVTSDKLLKDADGHFHAAHEAHRELLKMDSKGEINSVTVLIAHAQDHLMCSSLAEELIREIILLRRETN